MIVKNCPVLVIGEGKLLSGIVICMLEAGHSVWFWDKNSCLTISHDHQFSNKGRVAEEVFRYSNFHTVKNVEELKKIKLAVAVTAEDLGQKRDIIMTLEKVLPKKVLVAINSESIPLSQIQQFSSVPERVIGLNWVEPANTTYFLEVISNEKSREEYIASLVKLAKETWQKDPYVLKKGQGIRSRLLSALVREAFYLIENEYVTVEDIDRACRNDAGYYLPFAGNCRYMDLMGTAVYGTVMAELNPELSKATHIPSFFWEIVKDGGKGMENGKGFYKYNEMEKEIISESFRQFSQQIREIISRYPHVQNETSVKSRTGSLDQGKDER